nr:PREDICTED: uncharacterized protein LOC107076646 [Lepisosteus oculatus]
MGYQINSRNTDYTAQTDKMPTVDEDLENAPLHTRATAKIKSGKKLIFTLILFLFVLLFLLFLNARTRSILTWDKPLPKNTGGEEINHHTACEKRNNQTRQRECSPHSGPGKICTPVEEAATFHHVGGAKTYVVSPYFEHRKGQRQVRIISIVHRTENAVHYCLFSCMDHLASTRATTNLHGSHFDFPYGTADLLCAVPDGCDPTHVAVYTDQGQPQNMSFLPVRNRQARDAGFPAEFAVCISTMFGNFDNVLQFVQAMEMYRILGAQKVAIYKSQCSPAMETVLDYYTGVGFVEVIPWPIDSYIKVSSSWTPSLSPGDLHYYGQIPALNDCVYRYMYQTRYLLLNDIDEIILPLKAKNWRDLVSDLEAQYGNTSSFYFENNVFRNNVFEKSGKFKIPEWQGIPGVNFLQHIYREPIPKPHFTTGKLMVNPRKVFQLSVHHVTEQTGTTVEVSDQLGRLYHVRRPKQDNLKEEDLIRDEGLWTYASELTEAVTDVFKKTNLLKKKKLDQS